MSLDQFMNTMKQPRIALITACGEEKNSKPMQTYRLYRSSRIKAVFNRRGPSDMFILSAEHGLKGAHEIIGPYNRVMDEQRAKELVPTVSEKLDPYDYVVFFKGGAREAYLKCIKDACEITNKPLISLGFAFMGGINDLPKIISIIRKSSWDEIKNFSHVELYNF